jgi:hypothetical protein
MRVPSVQLYTVNSRCDPKIHKSKYRRGSKNDPGGRKGVLWDNVLVCSICNTCLIQDLFVVKGYKGRHGDRSRVG